MPLEQYSHPENDMPPKLFARTILIPTAMCSQVPMLSPVHIAPKRCDPAKKDRVRTNGLFGGFERA